MPNKTSFFNQSGLAGVGYSERSIDSYEGEAGNIPRVNAPENSLEFRTPTETLEDIGADVVGDAVPSGRYFYTSDINTWAVDKISGVARALINDGTYAEMRTTLGLEIGVDVQAYSAAGYLDGDDIGVTVQAYDATILVDADIGVNVEAYDATILKDADIGSTVQAYDATYLVDADIGINVEAYDSTILKDADIGTTVQAYDADTAKTDVVQDWTAAQSGEVTALSDGANISLNLALSNNFSVTLAGNRTLDNPTNIVVGQSGLIAVTQDGTGTRTLAYGTYYKFVGGADPVLTTTAAAVDTLSYYVKSSTEILVSATLDWS